MARAAELDALAASAGADGDARASGAGSALCAPAFGVDPPAWAVSSDTAVAAAVAAAVPVRLYRSTRLWPTYQVPVRCARAFWPELLQACADQAQPVEFLVACEGQPVVTYTTFLKGYQKSGYDSFRIGKFAREAVTGAGPSSLVSRCAPPSLHPAVAAVLLPRDAQVCLVAAPDGRPMLAKQHFVDEVASRRRRLGDVAASGAAQEVGDGIPAGAAAAGAPVAAAEGCGVASGEAGGCSSASSRPVADVPAEAAAGVQHAAPGGRRGGVGGEALAAGAPLAAEAHPGGQAEAGAAAASVLWCVRKELTSTDLRRGLGLYLDDARRLLLPALVAAIPPEKAVAAFTAAACSGAGSAAAVAEGACDSGEGSSSGGEERREAAAAGSEAADALTLQYNGAELGFAEYLSMAFYSGGVLPVVLYPEGFGAARFQVQARFNGQMARTKVSRCTLCGPMFLPALNMYASEAGDVFECWPRPGGGANEFVFRVWRKGRVQAP